MSHGYLQCHLIKLKSGVYQSLSMLFKHDDISQKIVVDNSKEQSLGIFGKKCCQSDYHLINIEPYSLWIQATEGCIHKFKRKSSRKILISGSQKYLWDH